MMIEKISVNEQIQTSASDKLEQAAKGLLFTLKEQGGVDLEAGGNFEQNAQLQHQLTSLLGIAELASDLRTSLFERAAKGELTDSSKNSPEPTVIANQDSFVKDLLQDQPQLLKQLAEIIAKTQILQETLGKQTSSSETSLINEKTNAWEKTIMEIAQILAGEEQQLNAWQVQIAKIKTELSQPTIKKGTSDKTKASYVSRLEKVLTSERGQALVDMYLRPSQAEKLADQLMDEYLATAFAVNGVRVLDRIERPGKTEDGELTTEIDLVDLREQFGGIIIEAEKIKLSTSNQEEKSIQLNQLDQRFRDLLIPVANKVKQTFPHANSTSLSAVLENEEAICAGKVNVLLATAKYLGINARANTVKEMVDGGTQGHVCFEGDLPSGKKLIVDANFSNYADLDGLTEEQISERIKQQNPDLSSAQVRSSLQYRLLARENANYIPAEAEMLVYTAEPVGEVIANTDQQQDWQNQPSLFSRVDPDSGRREVWRASVPHPHRSTMPDKDGYMHLNSSFLNNSSTESNIKALISDFTLKAKPPRDKSLARYLATKQIEISPHEPLAYLHLADAIDGPAKHEFLEHMKQNRPEIYWQKMSLTHAESLAQNGDLRQALVLFKGIQENNPRFLVDNLETIRIIAKTYKYTYGVATEAISSFKQEAVTLIEQLKADQIEHFFTKADSVVILEDLYDRSVDKIAILEEFQQLNTDEFWRGEGFSPPFEDLRRLYLQPEIITPESLAKAQQLVESIKVKAPNYFNKNVHHLVQVYLEPLSYQPERAIRFLNQVRQEVPTIFFDERERVLELASLLEKANQVDQVAELYQEFAQVNPQLSSDKINSHDE